MQAHIGHLIVSLTLSALLTTEHAKASDDPVWVRGVVRASKFVPGKDAHETFELQVIWRERDSLTGMAVLTREISKDAPHYSAIEVEGVERDGRFWPYVRGEVSDNLDKGWQDVSLAKPLGKMAPRHVEPRTLGETVFVALGAFHFHVGRKHYGRLVLPNGEAATFLLDNLKPPNKVPETWERARMGTDEELHPTVYEATFLVPPEEQKRRTLSLARVEGQVGRVIGHFSYVSLEGRLPTIVEQVTDYEEPVWPRAVLEAANNYYSQWTAIGQTSNPERPGQIAGPPQVAISLRMYLDGLRPVIGKYRYGRVVLSNGDSALIELRDLLPPERELIAREHPDW